MGVRLVADRSDIQASSFQHAEEDVESIMDWKGFFRIRSEVG